MRYFVLLFATLLCGCLEPECEVTPGLYTFGFEGVDGTCSDEVVTLFETFAELGLELEAGDCGSITRSWVKGPDGLLCYSEIDGSFIVLEDGPVLGTLEVIYRCPEDPILDCEHTFEMAPSPLSPSVAAEPVSEDATPEEALPGILDPIVP